MRMAGPRTMKTSAHSHSKLQPLFLPLASGSSGLGASLILASPSSSENASVIALAANLLDIRDGVVSIFFSFFGFGAVAGATSLGESSTTGSGAGSGTGSGAAAGSSTTSDFSSSVTSSTSEATSEAISREPSGESTGSG